MVYRCAAKHKTKRTVLFLASLAEDHPERHSVCVILLRLFVSPVRKFLYQGTTYVHDMQLSLFVVF